MAMSKMPEVIRKGNGRFWKAEYDTFRVKVYVPACNLPTDIINYGFEAPYLLVFEETERGVEEAAACPGLGSGSRSFRLMASSTTTATMMRISTTRPTMTCHFVLSPPEAVFPSRFFLAPQ